ncbi:Protein mono-ADP-ribosyltransferase parp4 [Dinochytrium kinnereticum]|nr:Protein mono-ADP-ribosyltransferase parp4 [Dinochytrium kinnereticum]
MSLDEKVVALYPTAKPIRAKKNQVVYVLEAENTPKRYVKAFAASQTSSYERELNIYTKLSSTTAVPNFTVLALKDVQGLVLDNAGTSLDQIKNVSWGLQELLSVLHATLTSLQQVHEHGWMHGDVNPGNICVDVVTEPTAVKWIDFGLADTLGHEETAPRMGWQAFMPPELKLRGSVAAAAADVYSVGKVMEWILRSDSKIDVKRSEEKIVDVVLKPLIANMLEEIADKRKTIPELLRMVDRRLGSKGKANGTGKVSSLLMLSFEKIKESVHTNPSEYLFCWDNPRAAMLFPNLGYATAIYVIDCGEPPAEFDTVAKLDAFYDKKELEYRQLFAQDRSNAAINDDPFVLLQSIYDAGTVDYRKRGLTTDEAGMFFVFADAMNETKGRVIVPTLSEFTRNFDALTHNMFRYVNFDNVFVAGGCVLAALQPKLKDADKSNYFNSDIDVFIYGIELNQVRQKVIEVYEGIMKGLRGDEKFVAESQIGASEGYSYYSPSRLDEKDILLVRNIRSLTMVGQYPRRQIQIVFRLFKSPAEVLMGFDIDSCCFGYDGKKVYALPRALRALTRRYNLVDMTRRSASYEFRLFKYAKRGFAIGVPNVDASKVVAANRVTQGQGLAKLLSLEANMIVPPYHAKKYRLNKRKKDRAALIQADRRIETLDMGSKEMHNYSHYQLIKIPYGEKWTLRRIWKYIGGFKQKVSMCHNYGPLADLGTAGTAERNEDDEDEDEDEDFYDNFQKRIPFTMVRNDIFKSLEGEIVYFHSSYVTFHNFESSWMTENPSQQLLTGSFDPVETTWDEWLKDAYDPELKDSDMWHWGEYPEQDTDEENEGGEEKEDDEEEDEEEEPTEEEEEEEA